MKTETIVILDFDGEYNQKIAKTVREQKVYCEVLPGGTGMDKLIALSPRGIILSGGDCETVVPGEIFGLGVPVLALGYSAAAAASALGGRDTAVQEFAPRAAEFAPIALFEGLSKQYQDIYCPAEPLINGLPASFIPVAFSSDAAYAYADMSKNIYLLELQLERHAICAAVLHNFLFKICGLAGGWTMKDYMEQSISQIRDKVMGGKVLCALSGGVDSSVCAALVSRAVGRQLYCIFVDHGLMRKNEGDEVEQSFKGQDITFIRINAEERFLSKLAGVTDPERKRKIIGEEFIRVFEEEAKKIGAVDYLVQGTIYPDIIESGSKKRKGVKSHHNVGGLPEHIDFKELLEPVKMLFKDEVRQLGRELGLPEYLVSRQPFPGPGLAVRCIGELTKTRLDILRDCDAIFRDELASAGLSKNMSQYFAVMTDMRSVGVRNNERTYDYAIALRAVSTVDFMTAVSCEIPFEILSRIARRIVGEVSGVSRILYDITDKPPATIEFE